MAIFISFTKHPLMRNNMLFNWLVPFCFSKVGSEMSFGRDFVLLFHCFCDRSDQMSTSSECIKKQRSAIAKNKMYLQIKVTFKVCYYYIHINISGVPLNFSSQLALKSRL
jgi:hypothetical protein